VPDGSDMPSQYCFWLLVSMVSRKESVSMANVVSVGSTSFSPILSQCFKNQIKAAISAIVILNYCIFSRVSGDISVLLFSIQINRYRFC
jgi:hypothetical protein